MFEARGPQAQEIVLLWWILFGISAFVLLVVSVFTIVGALRKNEVDLSSDEALGKGLFLGVGATLALLIVIIVSTFKLAQPLAEVEGSLPVKIEIVGKMWWWEAIYFDDTGSRLFKTANEIHIPIGEPIKLALNSDTVIHSFWVPALAGKVDMIPGRTHYLTLQAQSEGSFRGQCAEFCGIQHALMGLYVRTRTQSDYAKWVKAQTSRYEKRGSQGERVFAQAGCANCHSVRGLSLASELKRYGPDLTHFASRSHLAAASLLNNRGHLGGWISDPQSAKPGNYMPPTLLSSEDFKALMLFLEELR